MRRPEEYHGLSAAEAADMDAMGCSRVEWERHRTMIAHGDLCASLMHLRRAEDWFQRSHPELAGRLANLAAKMGAMVPSYQEFSTKQRTHGGAARER